MVTFSTVRTTPVQFNFPSDSGPINITNTGGIATANTTALRLYSAPYTVQIDGRLSVNNAGFAGTAVALELYPAPPFTTDSNITIGTTGRVAVSHGPSMLLFGQTNITNNGRIDGGISFPDFRPTDTSTIVNNGQLYTKDIGGFAISSGAGAETVVNTGTIFGQIDLYSGKNSLTNSGLIVGNVDVASGNDRIENKSTGIIRGDINSNSFGDLLGSDIVINVGRVEGRILANGAITNVNNSGVVTGYIEGGRGNDTIVNSGTLQDGLFDTGGTNRFTNSGKIYDAVMFGNSTDTFSNSGTVYSSINMYDGTNIFKNLATGIVTGDVTGGSGSDTVSNAGRIDGNVRTFNGYARVDNSGTIHGYIDASGTGGSIISNTGTILGGGIAAGAGGNTITNTGTIVGGISTGSGVDRVTNSGQVSGEIVQGAGNDTFVGGAFAEIVRDQGGSDTYKLGGGDDKFLADTGAGGIDTVDAGTQSTLAGDLYSLSGSANNSKINLDTINHVDVVTAALTVAANLATGTDIGTDKVFNFESVIGGSGDDLVFGNTAANTLSGNAGNDRLYGFAGNDILKGGQGSDFIVGGLGADVLSGNDVGLDFERDTFRFQALNESINPASGRDTIRDFDDSNADVLMNDVIDFSGMTSVAGKHWNTVGDGINDAFDGATGSVRAVLTSAGWLIQMDADGNKVADMSIYVLDPAQTITWDAANFLF
jgi:Ca2+-binding RTX toxin-like protein